MSAHRRPAEIKAWHEAGGRFYEPGWPPMFEPQPFTPKQEMTETQRDNMRRGREAANERVRAHKQMSRGHLAHATGTPFNPQHNFPLKAKR